MAVQMTSRPVECPTCWQWVRPIPVLYGLPMAELMAEADAGRATLKPMDDPGGSYWERSAGPRSAVLPRLLGLVLAGGCIAVFMWLDNMPSTEDRKSMAADMQAAAPDLIVGHYYRRGSLIDNASLSIFLSGDPTDEQVRRLACDVIAPTSGRMGIRTCSSICGSTTGNGEWKGEVREICATGS
jgi:hypothetical protein